MIREVECEEGECKIGELKKVSQTGVGGVAEDLDNSQPLVPLHTSSSTKVGHKRRQNGGGIITQKVAGVNKSRGKNVVTASRKKPTTRRGRKKIPMQRGGGKRRRIKTRKTKIIKTSQTEFERTLRKKPAI